MNPKAWLVVRLDEAPRRMNSWPARAGPQVLRWSALCSAGVLLAAVAAAQGTNSLISKSSSNVQGDSASSQVAMSSDGRFFAYVSSATNLVAGDTNNLDDIFVSDSMLGLTTRVSVDSSGNQGNNQSGIDKCAISDDGHYVVFPSWSSNLVFGDTNGNNDLFLHDCWSGMTTRISVDAAGNQVFGNSDDCVMSADGSIIACDSDAPELWSPDTNWEEDVIVFDLTTGVPICVSVNPAGAASNGESLKPGISADGRWVAFTSTGSDLVANDTNNTWDTFLRDMATGQTWRVSVDSSGNQADGPSDFWSVSVSADGRYVAFSSSATNLVAGDTNGMQDVFVHDHLSGETLRVSLDSLGNEGNADSSGGRVSADGLFISFASDADNLVPGDTNFALDVFVRDMQRGFTSRVSVDNLGQEGNGASTQSQISGDGQLVAFMSDADNLVFPDTNSASDILLHDPAGNCGSVGTYCIAMSNSTGHAAQIGWQGSTSISSNDMLLLVSGCPPNKPGLFFFGCYETQIPFGEGYLCITGQQHRLQPGFRVDPSGSGAYALDFTNPASTASLILPGSTWKFQFWYRDPQSVGHGFNLSDALSATFCP